MGVLFNPLNWLLSILSTMMILVVCSLAILVAVVSALILFPRMFQSFILVIFLSNMTFDVSIFYSRNFSLEYDIQAEARNYRGGSERHTKVTRYDLVTPGTIDEQVLKAHLLANKKLAIKF